MTSAASVRVHIEGIQPILRVDDMRDSLHFYMDVLRASFRVRPEGTDLTTTEEKTNP
jgi:hypothetical protein